VRLWGRTLVLLSLFYLFGIATQGSNLLFSRLNGFTQLSSHYVNCMVQDDFGYLWIGTQNGLNRFDGQNIKVYKEFRGSTQLGPIGNQIDNLVVDSYNRVWLSTMYGVAVYNPEEDIFDIVASYNYPRGLLSTQIEFMQVDDEGQLIVGSRETIYRFDEDSSLFIPVLSSPFGVITSLLIDNKGGWWIGHYDGGGVSYYQNIENLSNYRHYANEFNCNQADFDVMDIQSAEGYIWIAIESDGLARLDINNQEVKLYFKGSAERHFFDLYTDNDDHLWACDYSGLKHYIAEKDSFMLYYFDSKEPGSLAPNLKGVFQDRQGNLYTFHNGEGVYVSNVTRGFKTYNTSDTHFWQTTHPSISSLCEDDKGNLWLGNYDGGIDVFMWDANKKIYYAPIDAGEENTLGRGSVLEIFKDSRGQMWVGTYDGGLNLFDDKTSTFKSWTKGSKPSSVTHNDVRSITEDSLGNLWLGLHGGGVDYFNLSTLEFKNYNERNSGLGSDWVHDVLIDSKGRLWVGTVNGLSCLHKDSTTFINYLTNSDGSSLLPGNQVLCLFEDSNDGLWIGTNNGLFFFEESSNTFVEYTKDASNSYITSIEEDQAGNIWFGTMGGLFRLDISTKELFLFVEDDGLQGMGFNLRASYFDGQDKLFFAGSKGVNFFNSEELYFNENPPVIRFSGLKLFNETIDDYGDGHILEKEINLVDEIKLDYDQNFFTFEFVALDFIDQSRVNYACKMQGFDDDWVFLGNKGSVSYTNLNPGNYIFRVKACNNDGVWNEEGISIKVRILPPWWQKVWFLFAVVAFLFFSIFAFYRYRTAILRRQKRLLLSKVESQTEQLRKSNKRLKDRAMELDRVNHMLEERQKFISEQSEELECQAENLKGSNEELLKLIETKDKLFSIIAHDLRSPFNTIMGFSSLLAEAGEDDNIEQLKSYARYVNDASIIVFNLLENLLYWARSQTNEIQFKPSSFYLDEIVRENIDLVRETMIKKEIKLDDGGYKNILVYGDVNMMRTVFRNLIINAIKFTQKGGLVTITSKDRGNVAEICVADNGVGMSDQEMAIIFKSSAGGYTQKGTDGEKGSGLGLELCKEFISRNGGELKVVSELGKGSSFCFSVPKQKTS